MREVEAVAFEADAARTQAAALKNAQENKIGRVFDEDDIAGVAQRFEGHVKQLLRTAGDERASGRVIFPVPGRHAHLVEFLQMFRGELAQG